MRKLLVSILFLGVFLSGCALFSSSGGGSSGSRRQLRAACNRYFTYIQADDFDSILEMTVPDSEYYKRLSRQMPQLKRQRAEGTALKHDFKIISMEINEDEAIVKCIDKISAVGEEETAEVDFTLVFHWFEGQWMIYTTK